MLTLRRDAVFDSASSTSAFMVALSFMLDIGSRCRRSGEMK